MPYKDCLVLHFTIRLCLDSALSNYRFRIFKNVKAFFLALYCAVLLKPISCDTNTWPRVRQPQNIIDTSSQMMISVSRIKSASAVWALMSQMLSLRISIGILNLKYVRPPSSKIDATPENIADHRENEHRQKLIFSTNILPVPTGPSIKISPPT